MGPGTNYVPASRKMITQISKEYALNTMLKAEMMKAKPQVPESHNVPLRASLSPHYKRARDLQKTISEMGGVGDQITTKTAIVNAKIELNHLLDKQNRIRK